MIPEDWAVSKLREVTAHIFSGGTPDTRKPEYWNGSLPWLSSGETRQAFIRETERKITQAGVDNSSTRLAKKGDVVVAVAGQGYTRGQPSYLSIDTYINQSVVALRANKEKLVPLFLFYNLLSRYGELRQLSDAQSSRGSLTTKLLADLTIKLPPVTEQETMSRILSGLDFKIELNQRMNKTLEAIGKAIFKHWFIEFEFPNEEGKPYTSSGGELVYNEKLGREIPKRWEVTTLGQVAEFTRGFSYSGSEKSKIAGEYVFVTLNSVKEGGGFKREFSYLSSDRAKERHFVHSGDIVIANTEQTKTGTLLGCPALVEFPAHYERDKGVFSHHITKAVPKSPNFKHYLYYHLLTHQRNAVKYHTGSVIWALDVGNWSKIEKITVPIQEMLIEFESLMENVARRFFESNLQIETLSSLRDSLLPKFMSGKIRVPVEVR